MAMQVHSKEKGFLLLSIEQVPALKYQ